MLIFEKGNIVTGSYPVFCHQVNCKGVMGSGLAKQIRNEYPEVYHEYKHICDTGKAILGVCHFTKTSDSRICIDMFAQDEYGRDKQYTNYNAFKTCLRGIRLFMQNGHHKSVAFPKGIGCGLGGGDWNYILGLLKEFAESIPWDVIIVEKE